MSLLTPDLVGLTTPTSHEEIAVADWSIANITQKVENVLLASGWTITSKTLGVLGFYEYECYSAQSPWYDAANVPSWYIGGRVWLKITHSSTVESGGWTNRAFRFQIGEYYNGAAVNKSASLFWCNYDNFGHSIHVYAGPHEFRIWGGEDERVGPSPSILITHRFFYCGALNIPRPVLQKQKAISSIAAQGRVVGAARSFYYCWRTRSVLYTSTFTNDLNNLEGRYPPSTLIRSTLGVWVPSVDPGMTLNKWRPFLIPAFVTYRPAELAASEGFARIYGFMWDSFYAYSPTIGVSKTSLVPNGTTTLIGSQTFMQIFMQEFMTTNSIPSFEIFPSLWLKIS